MAFVYGAWWQVIDGHKSAVVKLEQEEFTQLMEAALVESGGDVKRALEIVREDVIRRLRQL